MVYQELMIEIINRIKETGMLSLQDLHQLLETESTHAIEYLHQQARAVADAVYGKTSEPGQHVKKQNTGNSWWFKTLGK